MQTRWRRSAPQTDAALSLFLMIKRWITTLNIWYFDPKVSQPIWIFCWNSQTAGPRVHTNTHTHTDFSAGFKSPEVNKQTTIRGSQTRRKQRGVWGEIMEEQRQRKKKNIYQGRFPRHFKRHKCSKSLFEMHLLYLLINLENKDRVSLKSVWSWSAADCYCWMSHPSRAPCHKCFYLHI